ncbi:MAG TPA: EAL domain-containing protein, partial [Tepidisphaeraceae bacterium]|nr:EAL domain-containing protein [Tepidisphaeraceae bacterium]
AVLGLDYDALTFTLQKSWSRASAVGIVMTVAIIYLAAGMLIVNTRNESRRQLDAAMHDRLTGLPNRVLLLDRIRMAMTRMHRDPGRMYAVLFIDFDHFKVINDSLGHSLGDELLSTLAERLRTACRGSDTVSAVAAGRRLAARLGGDEFVILLEDIDSPLAAAGAASRLLAVLSEPIRLQGRDVQMSASIGIAIGETRYQQPEELLRDADIAMYRAKHAGRNGYAIFDQHMHAAAIQRLNLETGLRQALVRNELHVVFQPVVRVCDQRVLGFETLLRWNSESGPVSPAEFIPLAEETGMIVPIGLWVLREACRNAVEWNRESKVPIFVNVNLSRRQLHAPDLTESVRTILAETALPAHLLKLEITESTIMDDPDRAVAAMADLRALGLELHIDDFGVGYSSLSSLNHFPINGLKLDRTFIDELDPHGQRMKIVRAVISLAQEHLATLRRLGCPMAQGYFFARPMPADLAIEYLKKSRAFAA